MVLVPTIYQMAHLSNCDRELQELGAAKGSELWKLGMTVAANLEEIGHAETDREQQVIFNVTKKLVGLLINADRQPPAGPRE